MQPVVLLMRNITAGTNNVMRTFNGCFGIVGSGNRNFNHQYCLTAKQYSERFGFPVLDTFELRELGL